MRCLLWGVHPIQERAPAVRRGTAGTGRLDESKWSCCQCSPALTQLAEFSNVSPITSGGAWSWILFALFSFSGFLFYGNTAIPDTRGDEDETAAGGEPDQKWHRQIKPRADRARSRKSAAKIRVKRAGPRALQAFLQYQFQRGVGTRQGDSASVGANQTLGGGRFGAVSAQPASAVGANGDGFGLVRSTFHGC